MPAFSALAALGTALGVGSASGAAGAAFCLQGRKLG